jgi:rod shape-determining protein MreC
VVGLVVLSLGLLTVSFRSTALDPIESASASALRPFEIAANRVAHPFRDAADWTHGLFNAKAQNKKLRAENARLRRINAQLTGAGEDNAQLQKLLNYVQGPRFPKDYGEVGARVLTSPSALDQSITISAGSNHGIKLNDIVITNEGLVGTISKVFGGESRVTLITDPTSAVRAVDEKNLAAVGLLDHGTGASALVLDRVGKDKPPVNSGDTIITAGSPAGAKLPSLYPRGIPVGFVSSVGQNDTDIFKDIQVQPFVDFSSLESVLVLIPKPAPPAHKKHPGRP